MHLTSTVCLKLVACRDIHERRDYHSEAGATNCELMPADDPAATPRHIIRPRTTVYEIGKFVTHTYTMSYTITHNETATRKSRRSRRSSTAFRDK